MTKNVNKKLEKISFNATKWIGSPPSLVFHTLFFMGIFLLKILKIPTEQILLILTTVVSLEAIYLAIFIQMTVNRNTLALESVEDDIEDIQEDVQSIEDDVEEISEEIEDLGETQTNTKLLKKDDRDVKVVLKDIDEQLQKLNSDLVFLKQKGLI